MVLFDFQSAFSGRKVIPPISCLRVVSRYHVEADNRCRSDISLGLNLVASFRSAVRFYRRNDASPANPFPSDFEKIAFQVPPTLWIKLSCRKAMSTPGSNWWI